MAAGLSIFSYQQRHDLNGKPYPGVRYYFYAADTSDPIDTYREPTLASKHPNPVVADAYGVLPGIFIADTVLYYRVRVTTSAGVILSDDAIVANLVPSTGEGDPPTPIDENSVFKTGDLKHRYGEGIHEGWLPLNGRTFGSSTSGADYVADDYEGLFLYLWAIDDGGVVGGAGANAAADWAANKQFTLPDAKGYALVGLDDMDDDAAGVIAALTSLGAKAGGSTTLTSGQIPQLSGTTSSSGAHTHTYTRTQSGTPNSFNGGDGGNINTSSQSTSSDGAHTHTVTVGASSPTTVPTVTFSMGVSIYIKI